MFSPTVLIRKLSCVLWSSQLSINHLNNVECNLSTALSDRLQDEHAAS